MFEYISTTIDSIYWENSQWLAPACLAAVVLSILVILSYRKIRLPTGLKVLAVTLKIIAIGLMLLCALKPMRRIDRASPMANLFPILVDDSRSMNLHTGDASFGDAVVGNPKPSRGETVQSLLDPELDWRTTLEQTFDVRPYRFDSQLSRIRSATDLSFQRNQSAIAGSLGTIRERLDGRPVGGILLLTDGNDTSAVDRQAQDWTEYGVPIYPVLLDDGGVTPDAAITDVSVTTTNFATAPVTVIGKLRAIGMKGESLTAALLNSDGESVEEIDITVDGDDYLHEVRFQFRPESAGLQFYSVVAYHTDDADAVRNVTDNPSLHEATLINNRYVVSVDRGVGPFRVLYVAGRPNWEFKFLRRALSADPEVQLVGLLRIADKEPKFSFRAKGVNGSNPLFAGLGDNEEETREQYDEPVLIRMGVKESEELSAGFPKTAEELFAYHAVILDDVEANFFSLDQMRLLRQFVSTRGGGLLMLGGQESFDSQPFAETPLGDLSPVYAARRQNASFASPVRLRLTREGLLEPWVRLRQTEVAEDERIAKMPSFQTVNRVEQIKPGAVALAHVEGDSQGVAPAIVAQRFGKGLTAAVLIGDLWRWTMRSEADVDSDPSQAWRQIVRYLVSQSPRRVETEIVPHPDVDSMATLRIQVRDEAFLPLENAIVEVRIPQPDADDLVMLAKPDAQTLGVYELAVRGEDEKGTEFVVDVKAADGSHVDTTTAGWVSHASGNELRHIATNTAFLDQLASQTGGEVITIDRLASFVNDLPNRKVPVMQTVFEPLWHTPWWMLAAIVCLCGEWGLRRWKGLA
ncbi:glutamine amidotransferase [Neorhodopirellula pilleata]|uniref:Putative glutamine amidotransferase domain-containing protein n=1 Tax=Neorhodopirellula pilleata TaxID=2714738 RepID=A0A5C6A4P1_9BACT|nr:glutamine amidotransferase [Neorhodopirellula pilleata]TWT94268.1 hypothetical protein Pla100_38780 [Neorhodopirellula pilleata]